MASRITRSWVTSLPTISILLIVAGEPSRMVPHYHHQAPYRPLPLAPLHMNPHLREALFLPEEPPDLGVLDALLA